MPRETQGARESPVSLTSLKAWLTLPEACEILSRHPLTEINLRTLQRQLANPDERAKWWERPGERGWAQRVGIKRTRYFVRRSWVEQRLRDAQVLD